MNMSYVDVPDFCAIVEKLVAAANASGEWYERFAEHMRGDRADLAPLAGRTWDAVIDTSGYEPALVGDSARLDAGHYVFVSSISARLTPCITLASTWNFNPSGLMISPESTAAKARGTRTTPVARSISTSAITAT